MYEVKFRELQAAVTQLSKVPDDEFIKPMYETLDGLNIELGGLTEKQAALDAQLAELTITRGGTGLTPNSSAAHALRSRCSPKSGMIEISITRIRSAEMPHSAMRQASSS